MPPRWSLILTFRIFPEPPIFKPEKRKGRPKKGATKQTGSSKPASPAIKEFLAELEYCAAHEMSVDPFHLPNNYIEGLSVQPIAATFMNDRMVNILEIKENEKSAGFISIETGDRGVLVFYSDLDTSGSPDALMEESEEWDYY
jgi:hypothetical protein